MQPSLPDRLPEDIEAEASLLATCCGVGAGDLAATILPDMTPDDWMHPRHRAIWQAACLCLRSGDEIDAITLKDRLTELGLLDKVGGFIGLTEALSAPEVGRPARLKEILQEKRHYRELLRLGSALMSQAGGQKAKPEELVSRMMEKLLLVSGDTKGATVSTFRAAAELVINREALMPESLATMVRTGIPRLDEELAGWPGSLGVMVGKTSAGKTSFALQTMLRSMDPLFLSLEMSDAEVEARALANVTGANSKALLRGDFDHAGGELWRLSDEYALGKLDHCMKITNFPKRDLGSVLGRIEAVVRRHGRKTIFLDYLTLLEPPKIEGASVAYRVGQMSSKLKALAGDLGVAMVVLAQLNRGVEDGQRILLENIRESGQIEQDATWVLSFYTNKKEYGPQEAREVWVELLKNRNGARFLKVLTEFIPWASRFSQIQNRTDGQREVDRLESHPWS